jgi:hypothetical protein
VFECSFQLRGKHVKVVKEQLDIGKVSRGRLLFYFRTLWRHHKIASLYLHIHVMNHH